MKPNPISENEQRPEASAPTLAQQVAVSLKVMLATGAVLAGIWLLDAIAAQ